MSWTSSSHSAPPPMPTPHDPYSSSHAPAQSTPYYPWDGSSRSSSMATPTSSHDDVESYYSPPGTAVFADTSFPGSYVYTGPSISSSSYTYWSDGTYVNDNGTLVNGTDTGAAGNANAADAAASASAVADDNGGPSASLGLKVGMAVGTTILILGLILGITCIRRHRRRKERYTARDMRERGREDGMGHFDVLESPVEGPTGPIPSGTRGAGLLRSDTLVPPIRSFDPRQHPNQPASRTHGYDRASSVGGSSTGAPGSSAWEDDSEADAMANDGSTLARTISTDSRGSVGSEGTVRGSRDSTAVGAGGAGGGMDHPGYTYMSRRPLGPLSALGSGSDRRPASPFADSFGPTSGSATSSGYSAGHLARTPSTTLYPPLMAGSGAVNPFASTDNLARHPSTARPTTRDANHPHALRTHDQQRLSIASTSSTNSAGTAHTANTADTGFTGTTRTTLPEYTYISTAPELSLTAPQSQSTLHASMSPFGDANPFDDPSLPTYEGTLSRVSGLEGARGQVDDGRGGAPGGAVGMIQRDGPPAYSV
jgi:hypothetical protein